MNIQEVIRLVQDVQEDFDREEDQGILQRDMHKAETALAGKSACSRILRAIEAREGIHIVDRRITGRAR